MEAVLEMPAPSVLVSALRAAKSAAGSRATLHIDPRHLATALRAAAGDDAQRVVSSSNDGGERNARPPRVQERGGVPFRPLPPPPHPSASPSHPNATAAAGA